MIKIELFESDLFISERRLLNFKDNNFTFKQLRSLSISIAEERNIEHLIPVTQLISSDNFFLMKIKKSLFVLLNLSKNDTNTVRTLEFYSVFDIKDCAILQEKIKSIQIFHAMNFKDFWE